LGIGLGVMLQKADYNQGWTPLLIITFIGIGFVAAFVVARKFELEDKEKEEKRKLTE